MTLDFSDNQTTIVIALIGFLTLIVNLVFTLIASSRAQKAYDTGVANTGRIEAVSKQVDGLTTARVQVQKDLGDAKAEVARGEGRDEERSKQEAITTGIAAGTAAAASIMKPVAVEVVSAAPVEIKASIPLELKEKENPK